MFNTLAHITISTESEELELRSLVDLEMELTWRNLTNTAKLKLPRKVYFKEGVQDVLKRGSSITIKVGYGDRTSERLVERFKGYVAYVSNEVPLLIECEDEMFLLKQKSVQPKRFKKTTLEEVLNYCGITEFKALGTLQVDLFDITTSESNVAKVLEKLCSTYGIRIWYRNGVLHCGNPYSSSIGDPVLFVIGKNIVSSDLQYRRAEEVKLKVTAISNKKDGTKLQVEVGDQDGEHRTLNYYDCSAEQLKTFALQDLEKLKYTGYRGSFLTWAEPVVSEGGVVELQDPEYPERNGTFWSEKLTITAGRSGIRQKVELGPAL